VAIEREEFRDAVQAIRGDIAGVHARLDALNGRTRRAEENIVRLQERHRSSTKRSAAWGSLGVVVAALVEGAKWWIAK
jgi:hypothetical protein